MKVCDRLKGLFRRSPSRQASSRPHAPNEAASRQGPTEAIADQHSTFHASTLEATPAPLASRDPQNSGTMTVPSVTVSPCPDVSAEPSRNAAFAKALQKHIDGLEEAEKNNLLDASNNGTTANDLMSQLQGLSDDHEQDSILHRHSKSLTKFLGLLDRFLGGVTTITQYSPDISSLVVGGVRLLVDIAKDFTSFFERLSKIIAEVNDLLDTLAAYAETSREDSRICTALAHVYGDILKFYQVALRVFIGRKQEIKKHVSSGVFFQSQWEPYVENFGDIKSSMEQHLKVLDFTAAAKQIQAYDDGMRDLAMVCFMWVFHTERPLKMNELRYAAAITDGHTDLQRSWPEPEHEDSILNACANMLEVDSEGIVRPIHYSVQEYFTNSANFSQSDFARLGQGCYSHQLLATACIDELSHRLQSGPCQDRSEVSSFIQYAARHFSIHALKTDSPSECFVQKLKSFVSLQESYDRALDQLRTLRPHPGSQYRPNLSLVTEPGEFWEEWKTTNEMMHEAASVASRGLIEPWLDQESNVDEVDLGETALYYTSSRGVIEVVQMLPDKRANVNAQSGLYDNSLQAASPGGSEEVVQMLRDISSSMGISSSMRTTSPHPIPLSPLPNNANFAETWTYLETGLKRIMAGSGKEIDRKTYMGFYTAIHSQSDPPYSHLDYKYDYASERLYKHLTEYLKKHLRDVYEKSSKYADEALLKFYVQEWNRYTAAAKYNNALFQPVNRRYTEKKPSRVMKDVYRIDTLHLVLWKENMFMKIREKLMESALDLVKQRNSEPFGQNQMKLVKNFIPLATESKKITPDGYKNIFEEFFLEATDRYCRKDSSYLSTANSVPEYTGFLTMCHAPYGLVWLWHVVSRHAITGTDSTQELA